MRENATPIYKMTPHGRKRHDRLILIPARNEVATVGAVVAQLLSEVAADVVVIDDASHDGTAEAAIRAGAMVLPLAIGLGAWGAIRTGIRWAMQNEYHTVATMDADGQHPVSSLRLMLDAYEENGADVLIGSCTDRGSSARKTAWILFRKMTGLAIEDLTSGLRIYNRAALCALAAKETLLLDYQDVGLLCYLQKSNLKIAETAVPMCSRTNGHSRVFSSWLAVGRYVYMTTVLSLSKWQWRFDHKFLRVQ